MYVGSLEVEINRVLFSSRCYYCSGVRSLPTHFGLAWWRKNKCGAHAASWRWALNLSTPLTSAPTSPSASRDMLRFIRASLTCHPSTGLINGTLLRSGAGALPPAQLLKTWYFIRGVWVLPLGLSSAQVKPAWILSGATRYSKYPAMSMNVLLNALSRALKQHPNSFSLSSQEVNPIFILSKQQRSLNTDMHHSIPVADTPSSFVTLSSFVTREYPSSAGWPSILLWYCLLIHLR